MKRILSLLLAIALILGLYGTVTADVGKTYGTYLDAKNGVARVYVAGYKATYVNGERSTDWVRWASTGSTFAVGKEGDPVRYFVTNRHCVDDDERYTKETDEKGNIIETVYVSEDCYILVDNSGTYLPFDIVAINKNGADLAIIKLRDSTDTRKPCVLSPAEDMDSLLKSAKTVYAIGYPGSSDEYTKNLLSGIENSTITKGSITNRIDSAQSVMGGELIQMDASINPGNSGGPLVDEKGAVIGVCTYSIGGVEGTHAAVSVNELRRFLDNQNIPYETAKAGSNWIIYAIFGAVIVCVIVLLSVLLRKKPKPMPDPKPIKPESLNQRRILIGVEGYFKGQRFELSEGRKLLIGRKGCDICFPDGTPGVSRMHCEIKYDGKTATIKDLNSSFGTFVDQKKLEPNVSSPLHRSLSIDIGSKENRFILQ